MRGSFDYEGIQIDLRNDQPGKGGVNRGIICRTFLRGPLCGHVFLAAVHFRVLRNHVGEQARTKQDEEE